MDNDVVPELLKLLNKEFDKNSSKSATLKKALRSLEKHTATYKDVNCYAIEIGKILASVLDKNINAEMLPDEKMYFNIADRMMSNVLQKNHSLITGYARNVQEQINNSSGYHLKGQIPEFNQDRVKGIVNRLSSEDDFEKIRWLLNEPVVTFSQSIVDDAIEKNVEFQHKAGLKAHITRTVVGKSCDWCRNLAGSYDYFDKPDDIYRRHERCRCVVEYKPGNGKSQNVWSKKTVKPIKPKVEDKAYISDKQNWLKKYDKKLIGVHDRDYWVHDGTRYKTDGKNVVLDYSKEERKVADFISKKLGVKVEMIPRVLNPERIKTPDYLINGVSFDLKQIRGNGKNVIDGMLKKHDQSHDFILDMHSTSLSIIDIISQINRIYKKGNRSYVNNIILIDGNKLVDIFGRK